jgi:hypothetical protein
MTLYTVLDDGKKNTEIAGDPNTIPEKKRYHVEVKVIEVLQVQDTP